MFREIKSLISFLTIIPVGMDQNTIIYAAKSIHLFPLIGAFIGLSAGALGWLLRHLFDPLLTGILTVGFLLLITGLHHADGLFDFGDGLMHKGSAEEKIRVMRDPHTGVGGFAIGLMVFLATIICIANLDQNLIIQSLVASEASAKLAMVIIARLGRSAQDGMNRFFIHAMHDRYWVIRLITALSIALCMALLLMRIIMGLMVVIAGIVTASIIVKISERHFGGVTGDIFGAGNELARLSSLLAILVVAKWMWLP